MEEVKRKYHSILKALKTLETSLTTLADPKFESVVDQIRDSTIQRFEYSVDSFWKYLKIYMTQQLLINIESASPRNVLREAEKIGLLTNDELVVAIKMLESRNLTSHTYNEELAHTISEQIPTYFNLMKTVMKKLELS